MPTVKRIQPRIAATTIKEVKAIAKETGRTFEGCVEWLLNDAVYWWHKDKEAERTSE